ncbi:MAG: hypothetical protein ACREBS_10120 [Nitrososphaerales archaeon]
MHYRYPRLFHEVGDERIIDIIIAKTPGLLFSGATRRRNFDLWASSDYYCLLPLL